MAQDCLTVRGTSQAGTKVEHSEPTTRVRRGGRLTDKSYSRDNRLVPPKSSYRRRSSAPRCRLTLARRWRSCQAFGCSPIKKVRELGSDRSTPLRFLITENTSPSQGRRDSEQFEPSEESLNLKWTVLIEINHTINLVSRRLCVEIRTEKLTYIGEILRNLFRDNAEGRVLNSPVETEC